MKRTRDTKEYTLKYYRSMKEIGGMSEPEEITKEKALEIVLCSYRDCDVTRDMLEMANRIPCMFSEITVNEVYLDGSKKVLVDGQCGMIPDKKYDDDGNEVKEVL